MSDNRITVVVSYKESVTEEGHLRATEMRVEVRSSLGDGPSLLLMDGSPDESEYITEYEASRLDLAYEAASLALETLDAAAKSLSVEEP